MTDALNQPARSDATQQPPHVPQLQLRVPASPVLPAFLHAPLASPELASAILDALADAVVVYDAAGRIAGTNAAAVRLFGLASPGHQATLAAPISEREGAVDLRTMDGRPLAREEWPALRVLRGEILAGARTMDAIARNVDGQEHVLNISGAPLRDGQGQVIGAVCVLRDITDRSQLERELAERAAELESIFATQVEAVVFADTTGRIVRMNEAQRQLLRARGIDPAETRIARWAEQSPAYDAEGQPLARQQLPFYRALRGETVLGEQAVELYQRARDGQELVLRVSGAPVRDAQGRILGAVLTTYDMTQQRQLEQQRLTMMRVVAHDLASPVTAVRMYLQTQQRRVAQGYPPFTPNDDLFTEMDRALARMLRLLDDLRAATQVELGTLDLQRARQDMTALCRTEAAAQQAVTGREVRVDVPSEPVWVDVDGVRIGQVIANLLSNALKYSPAERPVEVTVRVEQDSQREAQGEGKGEGGQAQVRVAVQDSGPGIPAQEQAHLFEQFHRVAGITANDGTGGLGLGLYICKGIIERHGGRIGVTSTVGGGSTFWFILPLAAYP